MVDMSGEIVLHPLAEDHLTLKTIDGNFMFGMIHLVYDV
jgi:hypothetical protein